MQVSLNFVNDLNLLKYERFHKQLLMLKEIMNFVVITFTSYSFTIISKKTTILCTFHLYRISVNLKFIFLLYVFKMSIIFALPDVP